MRSVLKSPGLFSFRREAPKGEVKVGERYRCLHHDNYVETARVLGVERDSFGIPHVRFKVSYGRHRRTLFEDGPRILALESFHRHYRERIEV